MIENPWPWKRTDVGGNAAEEQDKDHFRESVAWICSSSTVVFTGILGTGGIMALRTALVRDRFTFWVFWLSTAAFAVPAIIGMVFKLRPSLWKSYGVREPLAVAMLLGFIAGLIGSCILCTLRNL
jgi:hypothetical protein